MGARVLVKRETTWSVTWEFKLLPHWGFFNLLHRVPVVGGVVVVEVVEAGVAHGLEGEEGQGQQARPQDRHVPKPDTSPNQ